MRTDRIMFEACGILYEAGLYGGKRMSESIMSLHYDVCADDFKATGGQQ